MNFKPLGNRVLVRRMKPREKRTEKGIVVPETADRVANIGDVVAVGPGVPSHDDPEKIVPVKVRPGERVLFGGFAVTEVDVDGETLLVMPEDSLLGVYGKERRDG